MKTVVSIPDPVFQAGERLAQRLGISRSQLYSKALCEYVTRHDKDDEITRRLNEVYAKESSEPDPVISKIAAQSLPKESWK
jgi:metal-responsive CopG/Arc/MetJ family transcriptional regulator